MITTENNCVGCPQGCAHCGRDSQVVAICDRCQEEVDIEDDVAELYEVNGEQLCAGCTLGAHVKVTVERDD